MFVHIAIGINRIQLYYFFIQIHFLTVIFSPHRSCITILLSRTGILHDSLLYRIIIIRIYDATIRCIRRRWDRERKKRHDVVIVLLNRLFTLPPNNRRTYVPAVFRKSLTSRVHCDYRIGSIGSGLI